MDFKSGKPVTQPKGPTTELHGDYSGRMPDEFHNKEFEIRHPELVQPVHYDHYDPQVEGFFGAGYSYEPMERAHHEAEEHRHEFMHERSAFTPGHFTPGEFEDFEDMHHYGTYHQDIDMREMYGPMGLVEGGRSTRMDLYMPAYDYPA